MGGHGGDGRITVHISGAGGIAAHEQPCPAGRASSASSRRRHVVRLIHDASAWALRDQMHDERPLAPSSLQAPSLGASLAGFSAELAVLPEPSDDRARRRSVSDSPCAESDAMLWVMTRGLGRLRPRSPPSPAETPCGVEEAPGGVGERSDRIGGGEALTVGPPCPPMPSTAVVTVVVVVAGVAEDPSHTRGGPDEGSPPWHW